MCKRSKLVRDSQVLEFNLSDGIRYQQTLSENSKNDQVENALMSVWVNVQVNKLCMRVNMWVNAKNVGWGWYKCQWGTNY